ncbi:hypothetical protein ACJX0J_021945, partial [Zea mays]
YDDEPSIMKYIKIAAMLPLKPLGILLISFVTLSPFHGKGCSSREPDRYQAWTNMTCSLYNNSSTHFSDDCIPVSSVQNKMAASSSVTNILISPPAPNNVFPFSVSLHHPIQNSLVSTEENILKENNMSFSVRKNKRSMNKKTKIL